MRGAVGEHEGNGLALAHLEIGDRGQVLAAGLDRRPQHRHVLPADRQQRRTVLAFLDPGNIGAEAEADHQLHVHPDPAANAAHQPHHVGGLAARRHEIDQVNRAVSGLEPGLQDQGVIPIAARGAGDFAGRCDQPAPVLLGAEKCCKAGVGIEGRPAQPVDRSVAADQRRGLAIADQPIVFDTARQGASPPRSLHRGARPLMGCRLERGDVDRGCHFLERHRSRRRQFGCSSMVPGMLGWSTTPSRSSSETASSRDRVRARRIRTE